jgi:hypothetical protein
MDRYVISITIEGNFNDWSLLQTHCDEFLTDSSGIAAGFTTKSISTDVGTFSVKCIIIFLDESFQHKLRPVNRYSSSEVFENGLDAILEKVARKMLINLQLKDKSNKLSSS